MSTSLYEKVWLVAALALIAYPIGDLLNLWQMEPLVVMIGAALILLAGRKVGVAKVRLHG